MAQLTIRVPDALAARDVKRVADERGTSVNALTSDLCRALTDPEAASDTMERLRERLRRAGLLHGPPSRHVHRTDADRLTQAAEHAGRTSAIQARVADPTCATFACFDRLLREAALAEGFRPLV